MFANGVGTELHVVGLLREDLQAIRAVVFDKDGVIADSEDINLNSTFAAFAEFGLELPETASADIVGRHPDDFLQPLAAAAGLAPASVPALMRRKAELYARMWRESGRLCRGAETLLQALTGTGLRLGLCTNATSDELASFLDRFDLTRTFDVALSRDHVQRPKPAPDLYLLAAERLGVAPGQMLVIEDSPSGIRAATSAGAPCIAVATPALDAASITLVRDVVSCLDALGALLVPEPAR